MRSIFLLIGFALIGCDPVVRPRAMVDGEVYPGWYECILGVMYYQEKPMVNREGKPVQCEVKYMTYTEFCSEAKKPKHIYYGC